MCNPHFETATDLADRIDTFRRRHPNYWDHYAAVRMLRYDWLRNPDGPAASPLAELLRYVLGKWGCGRRNAPQLPSVNQIAVFLHDYHDEIAHVRFPLHGINANNPAFPLPDSWVRRIKLLVTEAAGILFDLDEAQSSLYPAKTILLLTGAIPAPDTRVRAGLTQNGYHGYYTTVPVSDVERLVLISAEWIETHAALLPTVSESLGTPWLHREPGRILDMLLFLDGGA